MTILFYTLFAILAGILIPALIAYRITSRFTRPLNDFIETVKSIARGNYNERVQINAGEELGQLADTFNDMAEKLEKTVTDLTDKKLKVESIIESITSGILAVDTQSRIILNNSVVCDILGLKDSSLTGKRLVEVLRNHQINQYLNDTIQKNISSVHEVTMDSPLGTRILRVHTNPIKSYSNDMPNTGGILFVQDITAFKKMEQIRTEFVSNVTHELKTPLTSIRGFIETLRSGAIYDSEVAENFLQIIDIEAERLFMLISDILQLSEIESHSTDTNITCFPLQPLCREVLSILEGAAANKNITLSAAIEPEFLSMTANRDRIKQALINLVDNGIKYNKPGGSVVIQAHREEGRLVLIVKDTGIGIAPEHTHRIFERFYRVDKGRSRNMGGTGLGLSIVKHIVNLYNGDIRVESKPGDGTAFILHFPEG